jgi:Tat protein secretion system quality control protein TatD with DNase activity
MIIDSHAHYTHNRFLNDFYYLSLIENAFAIEEGNWDKLYAEMQESGILGAIEPGVSLASNEELLAFCNMYPEFYSQL